MCWRSNDTVIKKAAERDFYVYKIGKIVWNNIFISDIRGYNYAPKCPNRIVPLVPYNLCVNPEGAEYFENKYGHIVSSEIIYTGKYLRISNFSK